MTIEKKRRTRAYLPSTPIFENIVGLETTTIEKLIAENSGLEISEFNYLQIEYKRMVHEIQCSAARQLFNAIGEWYEKDTDLVEMRIPGSSGQGFRFDPATHSNLIRPPIPGHPATLFG